MMSNAIVAELSSDSYATALGIIVHVPSPVLALCRKLAESSTYAPETPLNAYRGKTLCLRVLGIGEAAGLEVASGGTGFTPRCKPRRGSVTIDQAAARMRFRGCGRTPGRIQARFRHRPLPEKNAKTVQHPTELAVIAGFLCLRAWRFAVSGLMI